MFPVLILFFIIIGCSKDHDAPSFAKWSNTSYTPTNIVATYNEESEQVDVSWTMDYSATVLESIINYEISVSDSLNYNISDYKNKYATINKNTNYSLDLYNLIAADDNSSVIVRYINVAAVFKLNDGSPFVGPLSDNPVIATITRN